MSYVILHIEKGIHFQSQEIIDMLDGEFSIAANVFQENNFPERDIYIIHGKLSKQIEKSQSRADCVTIPISDKEEDGESLGFVPMLGWSYV